MPGWVALLVTILGVVLLLLLVIGTVFFSVTKLAVTLPQYMTDMTTSATEDLSGTVDEETATNVIVSMGPVIGNALSSVMGMLVTFGLALAIFFFMISGAMALPDAVRLGLDPRAPIISRLTDLTEGVRHYMTILTGINFLVGLGDAIFLSILGVDFAVLWGLLAWFMGYIPSIGFLIALIPPLLMAYAQFGLQTALVVLVGYILINGGVQNFLQPKIMGNGLKINPVVVFVSLFVWGYLLGGIGALLAVPLTLLVLTVLENFETTRVMSTLMRFTGAEKKEEEKEAMNQVKGLWRKTKSTFVSASSPKDDADRKETDSSG
jgi:predicted PurR-regulated permease PerM